MEMEKHKSAPQSSILDVEQAAEYTATPVSTLNKLRLFGGGPVFIKKGRRVQYDTRDLDAWIESLKRTSTVDLGPAAQRRRRSI